MVSPLGRPVAKHGPERDPTRIRGQERLGKHRESRAALARVHGEASDLVQPALKIEPHGASLHHRRRKRRHCDGSTRRSIVGNESAWVDIRFASSPSRAHPVKDGAPDGKPGWPGSAARCSVATHVRPSCERVPGELSGEGSRVKEVSAHDWRVPTCVRTARSPRSVCQWRLALSSIAISVGRRRCCSRRRAR